jgi:hypothetical protein
VEVEEGEDDEEAEDPVSQPAFWPQVRIADTREMMNAVVRTKATSQVKSSSSLSLSGSVG